jgi:hypothetical protein
MNGIETFLYETSRFFLLPVLLLLCGMFTYALLALGGLLFDLAIRALGKPASAPLARYAEANPGADQEALELRLLKLIEPLRLVSRVAPMLGLVATMIPMGPALIAVSSGDTEGMAQNLVVAFSAVIVALLSAASTYVTLSIRRRWLLGELHALLGRRAGRRQADSPTPAHLEGVAHG